MLTKGNIVKSNTHDTTGIVLAVRKDGTAARSTSTVPTPRFGARLTASPSRRPARKSAGNAAVPGSSTWVAPLSTVSTPARPARASAARARESRLTVTGFAATVTGIAAPTPRSPISCRCALALRSPTLAQSRAGAEAEGSQDPEQGEGNAEPGRRLDADRLQGVRHAAPRRHALPLVTRVGHPPSQP